MPMGVLIDTTNRLLGWSTGDFSLYGAQPAVTIGTPHTASDPTLLTVPSATPPPAGPSQATAPQILPATPSPDDSVALAVPDAAPAAALSALHAPVADPASLGPQVASPTGSGSTAPIVADTALPSAVSPAADRQTAGLTEGHSAASLTPTVFAATDTTSTGLAALAPAILALATPALAIPTDAVGGIVATLAPATDALAGNTQLLDGVIHQTALPAVQATVGGIADVIPDTHALADDVADVVAAPVHDAVAAAADIGTTAATVVTSPVDTLAETAAGLTATAAAPAVAAIDTLAETAPGLAATALPDDHLGGSDPAGGVTTLVSMVETADLFEIAPSPADTPVIATGGSIVDTLAADALPDALLGDAHHPAGTLIPDHVDHGGLGL